MSAIPATGRLVLRLRLQCGRVTAVEMVSTRLQPTVLLNGKTVQQAAQLVPMLFSLCGEAQGVAAQAALQAAEGRMPDAQQLARWAATVRREAALEHLWHLLMDWPPVFGLDRFEQAYLHCRQPCRQARTDDEHALALTNGLAAELLGMLPVLWLRLQPAEWSRWRDTSSAWGAVLLRQLAVATGAGSSPIPSLLPELCADWAGLERAMCTPEFCRTPSWSGAPRETGALARQREHPLVASLLGAGRSLEARLMARLTELARMACGESGAERDWIDVARVGQHAGLARVETARGILLHRARLEEGLVGDYAIVAPTEWNFHPQGGLVREICQLKATDTPTLLLQVQALVLSLDPCVPHALETVPA